MKKTLTAILITTAAAAAPALPFNQADQAAIAAHQGRFRAARTQAQLLAAYRQAQQLERTLETRLEPWMEARLGRDDYPQEAELTALGKQLPGFRPMLVAEGTYLALRPDYTAWAKVAAATPETADNALFALLQKAYGPNYTDYPNWFNQTWDYGGCSWLGKGVHKGVITELQRQRAQKSPFGTELTALEQHLLRDLTQSNSFCLPKAQVLKELDQILPVLPAHKPALLKRRQQLAQPSKQIEFDCEGKAQCSYG